MLRRDAGRFKQKVIAKAGQQKENRH